MRKKVTVVGAGNVGATCAQELARRDYADVVLLDVKPNFAAGKALSGPATQEKWYDLGFALPGAAKERYLAAKSPLVARALAALEPLWGEP